jgi:heme exporter protein A
VIELKWSFYLVSHFSSRLITSSVEPNWRQSVITADDLIVQRGDIYLCTKVNFSVSSGQILHVQGSNGIGKTTLLMLLAGLLSTSEIQHKKKSLVWAVNSPSDWPILYIGHLAGLNSGLSVRENLEFLQGVNIDTCDDLSIALDWAGLYGYEDVAFSSLSSGQKRRVSLARLRMSSNPDALWILDEPFNALDKVMTTRLCERLALHAQNGGRVILTSHQTFELNVQTLNLEQFALRNDEESQQFESHG